MNSDSCEQEDHDDPVSRHGGTHVHADLVSGDWAQAGDDSNTDGNKGVQPQRGRMESVPCPAPCPATLSHQHDDTDVCGFQAGGSKCGGDIPVRAG